MPKLEAEFQEEPAKALKDGFTADEVEKAKKDWLDDRAVNHAEEASIASLLMIRERWGRTMEWDARLEASVAALTPQQVDEAFRHHVDPAALSIVKGGDFKKAGAYRWDGPLFRPERVHRIDARGAQCRQIAGQRRGGYQPA